MVSCKTNDYIGWTRALCEPNRRVFFADADFVLTLEMSRWKWAGREGIMPTDSVTLGYGVLDKRFKRTQLFDDVAHRRRTNFTLGVLAKLRPQEDELQMLPNGVKRLLRLLLHGTAPRPGQATVRPNSGIQILNLGDLTVSDWCHLGGDRLPSGCESPRFRPQPKHTGWVIRQGPSCSASPNWPNGRCRQPLISSGSPVRLRIVPYSGLV